jgi:hypothetical protein
VVPKRKVSVATITPAAAEAAFEHELEVFRREVSEASQFFYAYLTVLAPNRAEHGRTVRSRALLGGSLEWA